MTTSSKEQLPARSPKPLIVHSTWRAPPICTPAKELATAMPKSLWQCTDQMALSLLGMRSRKVLMKLPYNSGTAYPTVSGTLMVEAPSAITASKTRHKKSMSLR